jgi:hypothetical protein
VFGLRPTARRARWLATVTAHVVTGHDEAQQVVESARRRLASVTDGALVAHRASRETTPRIPRLRAVRISADVDHPFRFMSITHFSPCRSPVSVMAIRRFG